MAQNPSAAGSFMTNFANGFSNARDRKAMLANQDAEREARLAARNADGVGPMGYGGGGEGAEGRASGQHTNYAPMRSSDPMNTALEPQQRAFLNAISANESAGKYNIRYTPKGGELFDLEGGHPRVYEPGPHGKSSAAGRYQFTWSTWRDVAGAETPFTPENQDKYAWTLADRDYRAKTGRDLNADLLQGGMTQEIASVLTPTWQGLGNNYGRTSSTYADSMARYSAPPPPPAAAPQGRSLPSMQQPADYPIGKPF